MIERAEKRAIINTATRFIRDRVTTLLAVIEIVVDMLTTLHASTVPTPECPLLRPQHIMYSLSATQNRVTSVPVPVRRFYALQSISSSSTDDVITATSLPTNG